MPNDRHITLYHAPNTRSTGVLTLLEALSADYEIHLLNWAEQEHKSAAYRQINPLGKVPAIKHGDAIVTEQVAIYLYLGDLYPESGLAPQMGDLARGNYLRWLALYGSCFEPAVIDLANQREPASYSSSPYGDFDSLFAVVCDQLAQHKYICADHFTVADVLWGSALGWITGFGLIPQNAHISAYLEKVTGHPAFALAKAKEQSLI